MLLTITARNINSMWDQYKPILNQTHIARPSRVGDVWEYPAVVVSEYLNPKERVLFNPLRNANPYFHLMEALWMLAGREDVAWISQFNSRMKEFSDDGVTFHGAYGFRWRYKFDLDGGAEDDYADQLVKIVRMLKKSADERRAVLCMWNPIWDLERPDCKDIPCNDLAFLKIRGGKLTLTVCCRSNDIVWGAAGSNIVHFSMLQEYLASMIGVPVGTYWQISDSWHAYTERWEEFGGFDTTPSPDYYSMEGPEQVEPYPLVSASEKFDEEVKRWTNGAFDRQLFDSVSLYHNSFFPFVATPLLYSWKAYKNGDLDQAKHFASHCSASDWRRACLQWLERIEKKRLTMKSRSFTQAP